MMFIPMLAKATPTTVLLARGKSSKLEVKTENLKSFRAEAFENDADSPCSRCQARRDKNVWRAMFTGARAERRTLGCIKAPQSDSNGGR